jgi:hypothetical protein
VSLGLPHVLAGLPCLRWASRASLAPSVRCRRSLALLAPGLLWYFTAPPLTTLRKKSRESHLLPHPNLTPIIETPPSPSFMSSGADAKYGLSHRDSSFATIPRGLVVYAYDPAWQCIARRLLENAHSIHTLQDDPESFLHVLSWVVLRFTPHELSPLQLTSIIATVFDAAFRGDDGSVDPGPAKTDFIVSNRITIDRIGIPPGELWNLLISLTPIH